MKTTQLLICAISVASALAASRAGAQTIDAELLGISTGLTVRGTLNDGQFVNDYPSGVMNFKNLTNSTFFDAFCVQAEVSMNFGDTPTYEIQDIFLLPNADVVSRLIGAYLGSERSDLQAAAVCWAIWKVTSDDQSGFSLLDGKVRLVTAEGLPTANLATQYLADVNNFAPVELVYLTSSNGQNVVTWNVVPEPGSLGLVAFSAILLLRRRR
jgi:hypothetical protein